MKPKFSQNFLFDKNIAGKIVNTANLTSSDTVVEIGPGKGILTQFIAPVVKKLICVEIDAVLVERLKQKFAQFKNVEIIHKDFLDWQAPETITKSKLPFKIISNLPYAITTPILENIFSTKNWSQAVLMMQKEVGERIIAQPGTKTYGPLTLFAQFYSQPVKLFIVSKNCFLPVPKVDSVVVEFQRKNINPGLSGISSGLFKAVRAAFSQRRKTITNSLSSSLNLSKSQVIDLLAKCEIDPNIRAECLPMEKFICLAQHIS